MPARPPGAPTGRYRGRRQRHQPDRTAGSRATEPTPAGPTRPTREPAATADPFDPVPRRHLLAEHDAGEHSATLVHQEAARSPGRAPDTRAPDTRAPDTRAPDTRTPDADDLADGEPGAQSGSPSGAAHVGAGILLSRLSGLAREIATSRMLGLGLAADAFRAALRIPNLLQNLLGEGVLSASFIPVYSRLLDHDEEEAGRVAGAIAGLMAAATAVLVFGGIVAAEPLTLLLTPGFADDPEKLDLTVDLVRIMFPGVGVLVLSAWCLAILNSHRRFFLSYVAPVLWNLAQVAIVVAVFIRGGGQESLARAGIAGAAGFSARARRNVLAGLRPLRRSGMLVDKVRQDIVEAGIPFLKGDFPIRVFHARANATITGPLSPGAALPAADAAVTDVGRSGLRKLIVIDATGGAVVKAGKFRCWRPAIESLPSASR